jgi:NADPH-dependent ferric siderophore reductase
MINYIAYNVDYINVFWRLSMPSPDSVVRRRPPPRAVTVARIEPLSPRMRRIVFDGDALEGFGPARPGAHIKLIFGELPPGGLGPGQPRPDMRTYTPRHFDAERRELSVDFLLHGVGLASEWAARAQVGDRLHIGGPGGGTDIDAALRAAVLLVDETAMPAAGMILDALPTDCHVTLVCEVEDSDEQRPLGTRAADVTHWLHRAESNAAPGSLLLQAARDLPLPDGAQWWVACESGAMRAIKSQLVDGRGLDRSRLISRGYWQLGKADHPDHDHGD